ncbi:PAS domain S-box protein [Rhodopseudomonas sp. WA056]|nr:PAS domain S-box protein [Rhodopseudomonas sp. WA056]
MFSFTGTTSRDRASALLAAIDRSQAIIEFDLGGNIQTANANFLRLLGYTLDDIKGRHHRIFVDPAEREGAPYREFWAGLRSGTYHSGEFLRIAKDGHHVWIQASYSPILNRIGTPVGVVKVASDVTAAKMKSLDDNGNRAAISRAQAVIEFAMDGTILTANDNFLSAMGYSLDEIKGKHHSMFVEPADRDSPAYRELWTRLNRGDYVPGEFKRIGKGGREVWILASYNPILDDCGKPLKVVKYATDITKETLANADSAGQIAAIRKSQAVIEFKPDGTILDANDNFLKTMGYSLTEIKGQHHGMFVDPAERGSQAYREFWAGLARGEYRAGEFRRLAKGGREVWIQASYNPIFGLDGRPYKVVKYAADTTAQVQRRLANEEVRGQLLRVADSTEELTATVNMIAEATNQTRHIALEAVGNVESADAQAAAARRRRAGDERDRRDHRPHYRTDQFAGSQCHDRIRPRRRGRPRLCGRRAGGQEPRHPGASGHRSDRRPDRQSQRHCRRCRQCARFDQGGNGQGQRVRQFDGLDRGATERRDSGDRLEHAASHCYVAMTRAWRQGTNGHLTALDDGARVAAHIHSTKQTYTQNRQPMRAALTAPEEPEVRPQFGN